MTSPVESKYLEIQQARIHYLETGWGDRPSVLLLHGRSFNAQTWHDLGTLSLLAQHNYKAFAVDFPGFGQSDEPNGDLQNFLTALLDGLKLNRPVVVSPSMSGAYSLPLVAAHHPRLAGFVAVAPVSIPSFATELRDNPLSTLAIWGSDDTIVPVEQADELCRVMLNARKVVLPGAGHACYMGAPAEFHDHLLRFLQECHTGEA